MLHSSLHITRQLPRGTRLGAACFSALGSLLTLCVVHVPLLQPNSQTANNRCMSKAPSFLSLSSLTHSGSIIARLPLLDRIPSHISSHCTTATMQTRSGRCTCLVRVQEEHRDELCGVPLRYTSAARLGRLRTAVRPGPGWHDEILRASARRGCFRRSCCGGGSIIHVEHRCVPTTHAHMYRRTHTHTHLPTHATRCSHLIPTISCSSKQTVTNPCIAPPSTSCQYL